MLIHHIWADNKRKLELAEADLKAVGTETTEENLKAQYIKRGGRIINEKPDADEDEETDVTKMSLAQLKARAVTLGLDVEGKKADILTRIQAKQAE